MIKQTCFLLLVLLITTASYAQTKRIAHRSHAGSNRTFSISGTGNFGLPEEDKKKAKKKKQATSKPDTLTNTGIDTTRKSEAVPPKGNTKKKKQIVKPVNTPNV